MGYPSKLFAFALVLGLLLAGCASLDKAKLQDPSIRKPLAPLALGIGCDVYLARVDLIRGTHTELRTATQTKADGKPSTETRSVVEPNPYHYVVLDLGNGIVLDHNHNLCLDLVRFFKLDQPGDFEILASPRGGSPKEILMKRGGRFTDETKGLFSRKRTADIAEGRVDLEEPALIGSSRSRIDISGDKISYDPMSFLGLGAVTVEKPGPDTVIFPGFLSKEVFRLSDPSTIDLGGRFDARHRGTSIEFVYADLFGISDRYVFFRTDSGCFFYNARSLSGVEVRKEGSTIRVFRDGSLAMTYSVAGPASP